MKRETSVSVSDLQELSSISDSVKRLALRQIPSAPSSKAGSRASTPQLPQTPTPSPSPSSFLSPANSPERAGSTSPSGSLSSSGASYISSELLSKPSNQQPQLPIQPLFLPSLVPLMPSTINMPIVTSNGRTFSQGGTVLDTVCARDAFDSQYELGQEIGRGGFSIVCQCRNRATKLDYAVKIVDLRPLPQPNLGSDPGGPRGHKGRSATQAGRAAGTPRAGPKSSIR